MATFRFLHCADLHLDSPLRGLEADPDAPVDKIRRATRDAFANLVKYAIDAESGFRGLRRRPLRWRLAGLADGTVSDRPDQATDGRRHSVHFDQRQS